MDKVGTPIFAAAVAITEMIKVFGYISKDDDELYHLEAAIAECRLLEELEMFNLSDGFAVDVWTGRVRVMTKGERLGILKAQLRAKDKEADALKHQIKALESVKPLPFNWRTYSANNDNKRNKGKGAPE